MFGISFSEISLIFLVALLVLGPERLPKLASQLGKFFGTARKTSDKLKKEFYNSVYEPAKDFENRAKTNLEAKVEKFKEEFEEKQSDLNPELHWELNLDKISKPTKSSSSNDNVPEDVSKNTPENLGEGKDPKTAQRDSKPTTQESKKDIKL